MERRSPDLPERSAEENFRWVADEGFDGVCLDPGMDEIAEVSAHARYFKEFDLACMVNAFPQTDGDMQPLLDAASDLSAVAVNVISGVMPILPQDAVPVVRRWMEEADRRSTTLLFETHRDGLLNDLFFTLQLLEMVPEMRLCADLSHFVVDRELRLPLPARDQAYIETVLERSDSFQGRVASREQIQIQLDFPQHQDWVRAFRAWWKSGMRMWRQRNSEDATLRFLCELGPPPYAITDGNGRELSDRLHESLQIRDWVLDAWAELDEEELE